MKKTLFSTFNSQERCGIHVTVCVRFLRRPTTYDDLARQSRKFYDMHVNLALSLHSLVIEGPGRKVSCDSTGTILHHWDYDMTSLSQHLKKTHISKYILFLSFECFPNSMFLFPKKNIHHSIHIFFYCCHITSYEKKEMPTHLKYTL